MCFWQHPRASRFAQGGRVTTTKLYGGARRHGKTTQAINDLNLILKAKEPDSAHGEIKIKNGFSLQSIIAKLNAENPHLVFEKVDETTTYIARSIQKSPSP